MDIVDSQVHLWAAESPDRPWPAGRAAEAQKPYPILKETLLLQMDLAGVRRMVLVPPSWEGDRNAAREAKYAARLFLHHWKRKNISHARPDAVEPLKPCR